MKYEWLILILLPALATAAKDWWETASFYQIYPRSFQDSNGDGIGDLKGITQRLDYLKGLGITAFWLSPIYKSPMADFGYDIADFYDIQPEYGTMADFEELVSKANALGLKVILDFVPNHSSDENEWFTKSVQKEGKYTDYYTWHPGKPNPEGGQPLPPSNWLSLFKYSAWKWNDVRKEYYLHQFADQQPDLNYRNPDVVEQMKDVLRFWLGKGIAGFRIDAVWCLFEVAKDASGNFPDEPVSGNTIDTDNPDYLRHIYTQDQPGTYDMVYQWRAVMDDWKTQHGGDTKIIMTEAYTTLDNTMRYYGNETVNGSHMPFNFQIILNLRTSSTAANVNDVIHSWMDHLPKGKSANWVVSTSNQHHQFLITLILFDCRFRWAITTSDGSHLDSAWREPIR
jgi:alpha-glucosidase